MADILSSSNPPSVTSVISLEKTPFWPSVFFTSEDEWKVRFNPGFLIDYQSQSGSKIVANSQSILRPTNMDETFSLENGEYFYLSIALQDDSSGPESVGIAQTDQAWLTYDQQWHFGSINVEDEGYIGGSAFRVPIARIDKTTGEIMEVVLRENVHYQKFHMENLTGGDARVLYSIGEQADYFGDNPPTQFRSIKGIYPIYVEENGNTIDISWGGGDIPDIPDYEPPVFPGGDTGLIDLEDYNGTKTTLIQAVNGLVTDIPDRTIHLRKYKVCVNGGVDEKTFLTLD